MSVLCIGILAAAAACGSPPTGPSGPATASASPVISEVVVQPQAAGLGIGNSAGLRATAYDVEGNAIPDAHISWVVQDSAVVSLSNGTATGKMDGSTTILASAGGKTDKTNVHVQKGASAITLTLVPRSDTLAAGNSVQIVAEVTDGSGTPVKATVNWSTSDASVATVDSGLVTAVGAGAATVTAKVKNISADASIVVKGDPPATSSSSGVLAAFPGAQGYGAMALSQCDRSNVQVLHVTNLQDSGAGSLRDAIAQVDNSRLSVIVFNVGGYIHLGSNIDVTDKQCLYIAGQTAPGGGITLQRAPGTALMLRGDTHDIVIRYLRFRGGYAGDYRGQDNLNVASGHDMVMDHLSSSWTTDKLLIVSKYDATWSHPIYNIDVQRTLLSEVFAAHPTAAQITGEESTQQWRYISRISLHHDLFANNDHRNPATNAWGLSLVNDVVYNWNMAAVQSGQSAKFDVVNSYFKAGPMADSRFDHSVTWACTDTAYVPSIYVVGNIGPHNSDPGADDWTDPTRMVSCYYKTGGTGGEAIPNYTQYKRNLPLDAPTVPVTAQSAKDAYTSVLKDIGDNARLACNGDWVANSDAVDVRVINDVLNGTGPSQAISTENDVGGFPALSPGTPCVDTDGDGMPDAFETRYGLNPNNAADASVDSNGDGYTNLEEFLNGRAPR